MGGGLEMATISHELYLKAANGRADMKRRSAATLAVAAVAGWVSLVPAYAAPPTVTPSPGYDARLQEQRAASRPISEPVAPVTRRVPPRRVKRTHSH
jgi:hypothetical protein